MSGGSYGGRFFCWGRLRLRARLGSRVLAAAVVPKDAFVAGHDGAAGGPDGFPEEAQVGAVAVEVDLARGGDEAFFSDDGEAKAARSGELFQAIAQVDFFAGEEFVAEAADFAEQICAREDVGTSGPLF